MRTFETIYVDLYSRDEIKQILNKYKGKALVKVDAEKYFESTNTSEPVGSMSFLKRLDVLEDFLDNIDQENEDNKGVYETKHITISIWEGKSDLDLVIKYLSIVKKMNPPIFTTKIKEHLDATKETETDFIKEGFESHKHYLRFMFAKEYINQKFNISELIKEKGDKIKKEEYDLKKLKSLLEL